MLAGAPADTTEVPRWQETVQTRAQQRTTWGAAVTAQWAPSSTNDKTRKEAEDGPGRGVRRPDVPPRRLCGFL